MTKNPKRKTIAGFIEGLTILAGYMADGLQSTYAFGGEHDIIHVFEVSLDTVPEDSPDGQTLISLGFHTADEGWAFYT
jgi:hypothetical protein